MEAASAISGARPADSTCASAAQPDTKPAAGIQVAADVVHKVLGTNKPLSHITQVRMHVFGQCKMGISFWPNFKFKAEDREQEPGSVKLIYGSPALALAAAAAAPDEATAAAAAAAGSSATTAATPSPANEQQQTAVSTSSTAQPPSPATAAGAAGPGGAAAADRELLHISFTKDPPDELNLGAKFLGGIPFPFITIRTNKLEGTMDPQTGAVTLLFQASFLAQVGKREPTSLAINATLTTEPATAYNTTLEGQRLQGGQGVLVSAAEVPKTPNWFANLILWLPTAATAMLPVRFEFS